MVLVYNQLITLLFLNIFLFLFHINKLCLNKGYVISWYIYIMFVDYIRAYILYKLLYKNAATFLIVVEECLTKELKERSLFWLRVWGDTVHIAGKEHMVSVAHVRVHGHIVSTIRTEREESRSQHTSFFLSFWDPRQWYGIVCILGSFLLS